MKCRSGIALLLALLAIVALELIAAALHFTAVQQVRAARSGTRGLQLRLSAQSAAAAAVQSWPAGAALATAVGSRLPLAPLAAPHQGISGTAAVERLSDSLFLVRAEAHSPLAETARLGLLLIAVDPLAGLPTAVLHSDAAVSLGAAARVLAGSSACDSAGAALELPDPATLTAQAGARIQGDIAREGAPHAALDELLPPPIRQALTHAAALAQPAFTPAPVSFGGACARAAPGNWGDPSRSPPAPCSDWFPALRRDGNLSLLGGRAQGLLFVTGDLLLSAGATFTGLVLIGGRLTLTQGSSVVGQVISLGGVDLRDGSIAGDRCELRAALTGVPGLSGPYAPSGRRWVPLF